MSKKNKKETIAEEETDKKGKVKRKGNPAKSEDASKKQKVPEAKSLAADLSAEGKRYDNPIPSREFILALLAKKGHPLRRKDIGIALEVHDDQPIEALRRRLKAMVRDGQLLRDRKGHYAVVSELDLIKGEVLAHRDGYGFLRPLDNGGQARDKKNDYYLSARQMKKVFAQDIVLARAEAQDHRGKSEASIVEVLERNTKSIVGRYQNEQGLELVRADNTRFNHDIVLNTTELDSDLKDQLKSGCVVVASVTEQPSKYGPPRGVITEVLGSHLDPGMEIEIALRTHQIPHEWPQEIIEQATTFSSEVSEADKVNRVDLRKLKLVTIDGEDARDFDDAVFCEKKKTGGWRLIVAIADVSHYVKVGSALDVEALSRATSVYFPGFVVPMLPEVLSNGLCSLNPQVDRLCLACDMSISPDGKVTSYKFLEGVMYSHARLTYSKVGEMLSAEMSESKSRLREQYSNVCDNLDDLYELYKILRVNREKRGAVDFDTAETRIIFNDDKKIEKIVPVVRNDAHKLIEECMLAANVCSAKFLESLKIPALYRVHEGPPEEKLEQLRHYLASLGINASLSSLSPVSYQKLAEQVADRADARQIQTMMLRSMSQAVYQSENKGHFGLAYDAYTHFTSPIRRYPDLLTHRAIRYVIRSDRPEFSKTRKVKRIPGQTVMPKSAIYPYDENQVEAVGIQSSSAERRADDATRDVMDFLKCEYLLDHVGDTFQGTVSAVTGFGLFIELDDLFVEGLIHVTSLPEDYYNYVKETQSLVGKRSGRRFTLGDHLEVQVAAVDLEERRVDLSLYGQKTPAKKTNSLKELNDKAIKKSKRKSAKQGKGGNRRSPLRNKK